MQSGCCGYTYGAQGCWNAAWDRDDWATSMWGDMPWYEGIDLPGAQQLGHLRRFYEGLPWARLHPAPECFTSTSFLNTTIYAPQVTADPEREAVVAFFGETYRNGDGAAAISHLKNHPYTVNWFDPRTGLTYLIEQLAIPVNEFLAVPDKPDSRDWVLHVQ